MSTPKPEAIESFIRIAGRLIAIMEQEIEFLRKMEVAEGASPVGFSIPMLFIFERHIELVLVEICKPLGIAGNKENSGEELDFFLGHGLASRTDTPSKKGQGVLMEPQSSLQNSPSNASGCPTIISWINYSSRTGINERKIIIVGP